mgnify:CR=1 FL=1
MFSCIYNGCAHKFSIIIQITFFAEYNFASVQIYFISHILPNSIFRESIFLWFRFVELFPVGSEAGIILLSQRMGTVRET